MRGAAKMDDFGQLRDVKKRAQARLRAIPGVHAVGVGPKITGGKHTGQPAIVIFVEKKKPLSELSSDDVIPAEIEGIKTDVHEAPKPRLVAPELPLQGGIQLQPGGVHSEGTLGCIARTDEPVPKIVAITCEHVVGTAARAATTDLTAPTSDNAILFTGANTKGAIVVVDITVQRVDIDIIQSVPPGTSPSAVAQGIRTQAGALASPGFT